MAHCELSSTKESSNEQIEDQINAIFFLTEGESYTQNLFLQDKLSTKSFYKDVLETRNGHAEDHTS